MAATPVEIIHGETGITSITLKLYPIGTDTIANGAGDTLTEQTNRKGVYRATVDEALTGRHEAYMVDGDGVVLFTGVIDLADTTDVQTVGELAIADVSLSQDDYDAIGTAVWDASTRTLTQSAAQVTEVVSGSNITIQRGDTTTIALTSLGNVTARTKLWFTAKADVSHDDTRALLLATEASGLATIIGRTPTASETCTVVVTDQADGDITITLSEAAAKALPLVTSGKYDIQMLTATGVTTLTEGKISVSADVTQAIA